jgi:putative acetyltransferase
MLEIRESTPADRDDVFRVEKEAFGEEGDVVAGLADDLLADPSAEPRLSLLAYKGGRALGHILFTRAWIEGAESQPRIAILAPLAVVPEAQKQGIGGQLIAEGLRRLAEQGVDAVFVLGHPGYYPRHGFSPVGLQKIVPMYPIEEKNAPAWMVQELREGCLDGVHGRVVCADALDRPEYWQE